MLKKTGLGSLFVYALVAATFGPMAMGQEKSEGKVIKTNLTSCSLVPGKVGTCEGTLVLESKAGGKTEQTIFKVTRDTMLKKGDQKVFLFELQGAPVTVAFVTEKDEKLAKTVVAKP